MHRWRVVDECLVYVLDTERQSTECTVVGTDRLEQVADIADPFEGADRDVLEELREIWS